MTIRTDLKSNFSSSEDTKKVFPKSVSRHLALTIHSDTERLYLHVKIIGWVGSTVHHFLGFYFLHPLQIQTDRNTSASTQYHRWPQHHYRNHLTASKNHPNAGKKTQSCRWSREPKRGVKIVLFHKGLLWNTLIWIKVSKVVKIMSWSII